MVDRAVFFPGADREAFLPGSKPKAAEAGAGAETAEERGGEKTSQKTARGSRVTSSSPCPWRRFFDFVLWCLLLVLLLRFLAARVTRHLQGRVARVRHQGAGSRVFGRFGQDLAGVAVAGDRRFRDREAAADPGVVDVVGAGIGRVERFRGEEEGVAAVGVGVEEVGGLADPARSRSAGRSRRPGRRSRCRRPPTRRHRRAVGVLGDRRSAESKKTRPPSAERSRGL